MSSNVTPFAQGTVRIATRWNLAEEMARRRWLRESASTQEKNHETTRRRATQGTRPFTFTSGKVSASRHRIIDVGRARRLLAGIEALAHEARTTTDPQVLLDALRVLSLQQANMCEVFTEHGR